MHGKHRPGAVAALAALLWAAPACAPQILSADDGGPPAPGQAEPVDWETRPADPTWGDEAVRPAVAPLAPGCLEIDQTSLDFGQAPVGTTAIQTLTLGNCGDEALEVSGLRFTGAATCFTLDCSLLLSGVCPTAEAPLMMPAGGQAKVRIHFAPVETADPYAYELEATDLIIESSADTPEVVVGLQGAAVGSDCPIAVLTPAEGDTVLPVTTLHLDGSQSWSPHGEITSWWWAVQAPNGPPTVIQPEASAPQITLDADLAGTYQIRLGVWDEAGHASCMDAAWTVEARPGTGIHVELVWDTPADGDPTDAGVGKGSDLDLHLLHPLAEGADVDDDGVDDGWFDVPWDCFWFNRTPSWGPEGSDRQDDPLLLRDDLDGAGPEVVAIPEPEDGVVYRVGVHYWSDHGFGASVAHLRVWLEGELVIDVAGLTLVNGDLWKAADIHWPSGEVIVPRQGDAFVVSSDYPVPLGFQGQ